MSSRPSLCLSHISVPPSFCRPSSCRDPSPSPLALQKRRAPRAAWSGGGFFRIIPYCKQMSTSLPYSCRGFRRNPLRRNGLQAEKLCAPLARQLGPAVRDRCRKPLPYKDLEIPGCRAGKGKNSAPGERFLDEFPLGGMATDATPLDHCRPYQSVPWHAAAKGGCRASSFLREPRRGTCDGARFARSRSIDAANAALGKETKANLAIPR